MLHACIDGSYDYKAGSLDFNIGSHDQLQYCGCDAGSQCWITCRQQNRCAGSHADNRTAVLDHMPTTEPQCWITCRQQNRSAGSHADNRTAVLDNMTTTLGHMTTMLGHMTTMIGYMTTMLSHMASELEHIQCHTLPVSTRLVNRTMVAEFCSQTILQKSSTVCSKGPCVAIYSLAL